MKAKLRVGNVNMGDNLQSKLSHQPNANAAAIAVIIRENAILLGLRKYEHAPTVWTAPGGSIDKKETCEQAVRREAAEETGIDDLTFVDYIGEVNADDRDPLYIFHCESRQSPELAEPDKFVEWRWFPLVYFSSGQPKNYINEPSRQLTLDYCQKNGII